jgi:CRP-like cAMP-binding protein
VDLPLKKILFEPDAAISKVHFPTEGIVSFVLPVSGREAVEVAMVGCDGLIGGASALNIQPAVYRAIIQLAGKGYVCDADAFRKTVKQSRSLMAKVIRHEHAVFVQAQQSAACNAKHEIQARLARWLLRSRDLTKSDRMKFTQEFLAEMLGARRTSVNSAASELQAEGIIEYSRGTINIVSQEGLRRKACECYSIVKKHYKNALGAE